MMLLKIPDDFHPEDCRRQKRVRAASLLPGFHSIEFDASELPCGIYFYRLEATDFIKTRKMILIK